MDLHSINQFLKGESKISDPSISQTENGASSASSLMIKIMNYGQLTSKDVAHENTRITFNALRVGLFCTVAPIILGYALANALYDGFKYNEFTNNKDKIEFKNTKEKISDAKIRYKEARKKSSETRISINKLIFESNDLKQLKKQTPLTDSKKINDIEKRLGELDLKLKELKSIEENEKKEIVESKKIIRTEIDAILNRNPQIIVIWDSITTTEMDKFLDILQLYEAGQLNLYRGLQQWNWTYPKDDELKDLNPKKPNSEAPPDFAYNDNSWMAMSQTESTSKKVACSWTDQYADFFKNSGGIDASKPVALVLKKVVGPPIPIAFAMDGEIQIKGPLKADDFKAIMIDDDWDDESGKKITFREFAEQSKVPIIEHP